MQSPPDLITQLSIGRRRPFLCLAAESDYVAGPFPNGEYVRRSLAIHALFGYLLFVSDSFLLTQPEAQSLLVDEMSLLREMLATKFAKIVTLATNEPEFLRTADEYDQKICSKKTVKVWRELAHFYWSRGSVVRMPRNQLAVGFNDKSSFSQSGDPRVVEFKKYSATEFDAMTSTQQLKDPATEYKRQGVNDQIVRRCGDWMVWCSTPQRNEKALPALSFSSSNSPYGLLDAATQPSKIWNHSVVALEPQFFRSNLSDLKPLVRTIGDVGKTKAAKELRKLFGVEMYDLIKSKKVLNVNQLRRKIEQHTERYLNHLSGVDDFARCQEFIKLGAVAPTPWVKLTLRDVLPAIISTITE